MALKQIYSEMIFLIKKKKYIVYLMDKREAKGPYHPTSGARDVLWRAGGCCEL